MTGTSSQSAWLPDLHWLMDRLAVGSCFPMERAVELASDHGVAAVVDLRKEDRDDAEALARAGIDFLHLPTPDFEPAPIAMLDRGVAFAREHMQQGEGVLIHCQLGIGRSPLLALCVMVECGFAPLAALERAKERRVQVSPSRSQYDGWAAWLQSHGYPVPDYHSFGCIAYRHLAAG